MESKYFANIERIHENDSHGIIISQIAPGSTVLECGCATGYMTRYMKEAINAKVSIIELNPSDYMIADCLSLRRKQQAKAR